MGGSQPEFNEIKVDFPLLFLLFRMDRFARVWLHASLSRGIQDWEVIFSRILSSIYKIEPVGVGWGLDTRARSTCPYGVSMLTGPHYDNTGSCPLWGWKRGG